MLTHKRKNLVGVGLVFGLGISAVAAMAAPRAEKLVTIRAAVDELTTTPGGEVDGCVLSDGTVVHWAPGLIDRFDEAIGHGEQVEVTGYLESGPKGDAKIEVSKLKNTRSGEIRVNANPEPADSRVEMDDREQPLETIYGTVKEFTIAPRGEIDGLILTDGTFVHWPPQRANRFRARVERGQRVMVTGWKQKGPDGDIVMQISNPESLSIVEETASFVPRRISRVRVVPRADSYQTVKGTVKDIIHGPTGEWDGVVLGNGTAVYWPDHLSGRFSEIVDRGDQIKATGLLQTGPGGQPELDVATLTNLRTGKTRVNPGPLPADSVEVVGESRQLEDRLQSIETRLDQLSRELQDIKRNR